MCDNSEMSSTSETGFTGVVRNNRGFTLVELIVVSALIGVLATMAITSISDFKNKTRSTRAAEEIRGIEKDLIAYATEKGTFPPQATWLGDIGKTEAKDPWGRDYVYSLTCTVHYGGPVNTDFDLYSHGADGLSEPDDSVVANTLGADNIIRAGDGSYVGIAKSYGL